jgi:hypothetical protein
MDDVLETDNKRRRIIAAVVSSIISSGVAEKKFIVEGKLPNRSDADYDAVVNKILKLKRT